MPLLNVYISHQKVLSIYRAIPPHTCPTLLPEQNTNIYDTDPSLRKKRKKQGKDTGKIFTEGWVEFEDKSQAKQIAAALNGQPIGGRRRDAHYYDLWCMKYLPKFKWDHLTEEINYQKAIKEKRLAAEVSAATRERDFYLSRVDKAKAVEAILERKKQKRGETTEGNGHMDHRGDDCGGGNDQVEGKKRKKNENPQSSKTSTDDGGVRILRTYNQKKSKPDPVRDEEAPVMSESVLKLIAGRK